MRGGQSTASVTLSSWSRFATIRGVTKKQTFSSAHTKRVIKKSKRLSSDQRGIFNLILRFFCPFLIPVMKKNTSDAQTLSSVRNVATFFLRLSSKSIDKIDKL
ncbi:TPA: hypothetical protein HNC63_12105 [Escherichia fergusonii]|nr:hypothetical protein DKG79_17380 [Escherichia fergusonii]EGO8189433.1 hypothetical protein [Escherichia fergusonii]PQI96872.1 hypothetical protein C5U38_09800 [Escherichia fergusonii]PQJ01191.1 hypothetical protein C5U37_09310 [Escherichia fergusonii]QCZ33908.1 hypothetical protein D8Z79_019980 [Escherichia fergusonii]